MKHPIVKEKALFVSAVMSSNEFFLKRKRGIV